MSITNDHRPGPVLEVRHLGVLSSLTASSTFMTLVLPDLFFSKRVALFQSSCSSSSLLELSISSSS